MKFDITLTQVLSSPTGSLSCDLGMQRVVAQSRGKEMSAVVKEDCSTPEHGTRTLTLQENKQMKNQAEQGARIYRHPFSIQDYRETAHRLNSLIACLEVLTWSERSEYFK